MLNDIDMGYAGSYELFQTSSKKEASQLLSADNIVGDRFSIEFKTDGTNTIAWMKNKFGALVAFFSPEVSRQLQIHQARGWRITALLSFVAYTDAPSEGYWGEAVLFAYDPLRHAQAIENFISTIGEMLADSIRPDVKLSNDGLAHVISSNGNWKPTARIPLPKKEKGMAILKRRRSISEKLIEQGRKGNKGCYAISWIFIAVLIIAVIAGVYFGLRALGVF